MGSMPRSRRAVPLSGGCLLGLVLLLSSGTRATAEGTDPLAPLPAEAWTLEAAAHLLGRAGFGGTPEEVAGLHARGLEGAVRHLVRYQQIVWTDMPDPGVEVREPPPREAYRGKNQDERREIRQRWQRADRRQLDRLREWWLRLMIESPRPLEERMTLFWHGHFTSGYRTVRNAYHMYVQNATLRGNAVGSFRTLLHEVARDPAMLRYLDGFRNRKGRPNENFAREVMELFTLGEGRYTEHDIQEAARAFTGWTFRDGRFVSDPRQHDDGDKEVLGHRGELDGHDVLEILADDDRTAEHVCRQLFAYFAYPDPEPGVVEGLAATWREHDLEIAPVLERLFASRAFYEHRGGRVKSPVDLIVGLFRSLGTAPPERLRLGPITAMLGQELFDPPNVKGWEGGETWLGTSQLLARYNVAAALVGLPRDQGPLRRFGLGAAPRRDETMMMQETDRDEGAPRNEGPRPLLDARALAPEGTAGQRVTALASRLWGRAPDAAARDGLVAFLAPDGRLPEGDALVERLHGVLRLLVSAPAFQLH